jgi:hypothetical protein
MDMCAAAADSTTPAPSDVRVRLDSLPVPLRVTAADQSAEGIAFEAELPWLAVGTKLDVQLPSGAHQTGWIQSFDMGVTPTGSARLRIFADFSPTKRKARRARSAAWPLAFVAGVSMVGASIGAYAGLHAPALRSLVDVSRVPGMFGVAK